MKQLLQSVSRRTSVVANVPAEKPGAGEVLVRVVSSLVSAGTEKHSIEFTEKNLVAKALARPDLVRQVLDKTKRDGLLNTIRTVRSRLDTDLALGYSNSGIVLAVGDHIRDLKPGDRVACGGGGYATHAEVVRVPRNLVAVIPEARVQFEDASFTTLASIAMQGFRLSEAVVGETVVVIGLGLVGLLLVQIAKAAGCRVIGTDPDLTRCRLAQSLGSDFCATDAETMQRLVARSTASQGADSVIVTAATASNGPVELAAELARNRGRVIVVGAVGLQLPRQPFYDKELVFRISCSYGPGRYDHSYEEQGHDYPIGFVRWTENRNMQAVLQLMAEGKLKTQPLITHRFPIADAAKSYELVTGDDREPFLGILIQFPEEPRLVRRISLGHEASRHEARTSEPATIMSIGLIGAGNFATSVLLPSLKRTRNVRLTGVCTTTGSRAHGIGLRFGFDYCTTDVNEVTTDESINTVVIATRHSSHARLVCAALDHGKHVFCEKPLCLNETELSEIVRSYAPDNNDRPSLMVGFNRRFSPLAVRLHDFVRCGGEPIMINYRVNAGFIPASHWTQDPQQGGGRVIGEMCHFIDFCSFLTGTAITSVQAAVIPNNGRYSDDNVSATLTYADGSLATITYVANGDTAVPKERIEVFGANRAAVLDDFRTMQLAAAGRLKSFGSRFKQDKGHLGEWSDFASAVRSGGPSPIPFYQIVETTLATFATVAAYSSRSAQIVDAAKFTVTALENDKAQKETPCLP